MPILYPYPIPIRGVIKSDEKYISNLGKVDQKSSKEEDTHSRDEDKSLRTEKEAVIGKRPSTSSERDYEEFGQKIVNQVTKTIYIKDNQHGKDDWSKKKA